MMNAEVLFVGSILCLVASFIKSYEYFFSVGVLMLVMAVSVWVGERKKQ